jgi:colanic acid/amylovoran biosynthesis glycosyltransferase
MTGNGALRLTYVVGTYPVLTTTFIDREVQGLSDLGADLRIISIRRPSVELSPAQEAIRQRVTYLLPVSIPRLIAAHLYWLVRRPRTVVSTLAWLLRRPHGEGSRLRTVFHVSTALYAAYSVRDRRGIHVHAHFVDRAATVALVMARLLDTSYSVTAHANDIYLRPVMLPEKFAGATFAATCTEYNRRHLVDVLGPRLGGKVARIYHGLDLAGYDARSEPADGRPLIVTVGQLKEKKGLRHLIDACRILADRGVELECEIVGDGPLRAELAAQIVSLGLEDRVRLTGALPHPAVVERYRRASVFVLPCVVAADGDRDGIPNAILEAMAMAIPVVSTPISGIPEVVRDGETGVLAPTGDPLALADALERLLASPATRVALGNKAREFVTAEFDISRNVRRLAAAFGGGDAG